MTIRFASCIRLAAWALLCAAAFNALWAPAAWAYVDPSVMTYTIQALAGVAVALSAVAGVAFRRARSTLLEILDVDMESFKTHEEDVYRVKDGVALGVPETASRKAPPSEKPAMAIGWRRRLFISLSACLFASMTLLVLAPLEIVAASTGSLVFSVADLAPIVIAVGLCVGIAAGFVLSALRGNVFKYIVIVVFALALGAYVQALFLNAGLPPADGKNVDWASFMPITVVSAIVWIVIIAGSIAYGALRPTRSLGVVAVLSCALFLVQGVGTASLLVTPPDAGGVQGDGLHAHVAAAGSPAPTEDGLFEVSDKDNIIVFVLDTFDTAQFERLVAEDGTLLDEMNGFTWYVNASGSMIPTRYAIPCMLTGEVPREGELFSTYLSERYLRSSFLSDLHACGYSIGLYSDSLNLEYLSGDDAGAIASMTVNLHAVSTSSMDYVGMWCALVKCSLYRDMPWLLKPPFWFYTDEINTAMVSYDPEGDPATTTYLMDDAQYFERLQRFGLAADDAGESGAFRFIHLIGPHQPYSMDEHARDVGLDNSNIDAQAKGSLYIVDDYLRRLKELGVYDDATIIVTADHGTWFSTLDPLEEPSAPIFLVKPSQSHDDASKPVEISQASVGHFNMQATIIEAAGGQAKGFGETVWSPVLEDSTLPRPYYATTSDGAHDREIVEYEIAGDVLDTGNWRATGKTWAAQE